MVGSGPRKLLLALACVLCCAALAPALASAAGTGSIHGTVTEAGTAVLIEDSTVCASEEGGEGVWKCAETDHEGEYAVENLPEGDYTVEFIGDDCSSGTCEPKWARKLFNDALPGSNNPPTLVHVEEGQRTQEIDAALELNSSIAGIVESASGPIPDTLVCVNSHSEYYPACAFTNDDGEYEITDLPPGEFDVDFIGRVCEAGGSGCTQESCELGESCPRTYVEQFYDEKLNDEAADLVTLTAGVPTSGIDATLVRGGRIEGTVTVAAVGDPPLSGIIVCAFSAEPVNGYCGSTDAAGEYAIEGLAEAPFMVEFKEPCEEEPCPGTWFKQFYDGEAIEWEADPILVTTGNATTGIDASMVLEHPQSPAFTATPVLTGDPSVGSTLSCSDGAWSNYPTAIAYAWQRNGATIAGHSDSTYVVTSSDERSALTCAVTVSNSAGSARATSNTLTVFPPKEEARPAGNNPPQPPSASTPTPPPPPSKGQATATGNATASGNTVTVSLTCHQGACEGTLKLVYETKVKNAKGKTIVKKVTIGNGWFKIAAGQSKPIKAKLNGDGAAYLAEAGQQGLKVRLTGKGVKGRTLTIKPAAKK
jgi:hypothetical protein